MSQSEEREDWAESGRSKEIRQIEGRRKKSRPLKYIHLLFEDILNVYSGLKLLFFYQMTV